MSDVEITVDEVQEAAPSNGVEILENGAEKELETEKNGEITKEDKNKDNYESKSEQNGQSNGVVALKYTYSKEQWSPINTSGKKVYDRDFLLNLKNDSSSKIKPSNLPDLDCLIRDFTKMHDPGSTRSKEINLDRYGSLYPGFARQNLTAHVPMPPKKFGPPRHQAEPRSNKPNPNIIQVSISLRQDVQLRETENAWKPKRFAQKTLSEDENRTETLYKKVRSVLNKLTPQKFDTLVSQVRDLEIDTQERLEGVIDLVFKKALDEPNFSVAYALMCKELSNMQVTNSDSKDANSANFRRLILTRCQREFEAVDENARSEKLKEIQECTDLEKKKELQTNLDEEERRMRIRSVGNIRFIGELFKQNMLTCKIMHQCIRHLLSHPDEENLECLCKLLSTIGKVLEAQKVDLSDYFKQMQKIAKNRKGKISSRIRFMLQDVIDLRESKWVPRRDDSNPKTIDQIQKEAEIERLLSSVSISTPSKNDYTNDRRRNR